MKEGGTAHEFHMTNEDDLFIALNDFNNNFEWFWYVGLCFIKAKK